MHFAYTHARHTYQLSNTHTQLRRITLKRKDALLLLLSKLTTLWILKTSLPPGQTALTGDVKEQETGERIEDRDKEEQKLQE